MQISEFIKNLKPYVPGRSTEEVQREFGLKEIIKLASNENSLGPSVKVTDALRESVGQTHLYPDGSYYTPRKVIADHFRLDLSQVVLGNGSNELIDVLIRVFCEPNKDKVITAAQSFVAYKVCAHVNRCEITEVPLNADYSINIQKIVDAITPAHKIVFIPNPNNPTGTYISEKDLQPLFEKVKSREDLLLVMDEAYTEFVRAKDYPNTLSVFKDMKNLVILRTFAKVYGMAGLRVGFMLAHQHVTDLINRVRLPFNVTVPSAAAIPAALTDGDYIKKSQEMVWQGLDYFYKELDAMGLKYCTSQGNFIFFDTGIDSGLVFEEMMKRGVILRPVKNYGFNTHLRMSVGTAHENEVAIKNLKIVLSK